MPHSILLFYCYDTKKRDYEQSVIPSGLYWIAAQLMKEGIVTKVLRVTSAQEAITECKKHKPSVAGFSCYTTNRGMTASVSKELKKVFKNLHICWGGPHATALHRKILEHFQFVDSVIRHEGEITFLKLTQALFAKKPLTDITGLSYRKKDEIIENPDSQRISDFSGLTVPAQYFRYQNIVTSRGCTGNCTFCQTPSLWGQAVTYRDPVQIVDEIQTLAQSYGIRYPVFSDDTFFADETRCIKIAEEIKRRELKIRFDARGRANHITEPSIKALREVGLVSVSIGAESADRESLKWLKKGVNPDTVLKACEILRKYGCSVNLFYIFGSPHDSNKTAKACIDMLNKARPAFATFYKLHIIPGTWLEKDALEKGVITPEHWFSHHPDECPYYDAGISEKEADRLILHVQTHVIKQLDNWKPDESELKNALKLCEHFDLYDRLGDLEYLRQDYDCAATYYEKSLELIRTAETLNKLGDCFIDVNEETADLYYAQALFFFNNDEKNSIRQSAEHIFNHAVTYMKMENYEKARYKLLQAEKAGFGGYELYLYLALCFASSGDRKNTIFNIKKAQANAGFDISEDISALGLNEFKTDI